MKVGDLIKMKHEMWWKVRNRRTDYHNDFGIVYAVVGKGIKVLMSDNSVRLGLIEHWRVISD